jgi:hypothetical protein
MSEPVVFSPAKRKGMPLHIILAVVLAAGGAALLWLGFNRAQSEFIVIYLFGALVPLAILPFVVYRAYSLAHASYSIERDGLSIRWGLRKEDIPFTELEWIRPMGEMTEELDLPPLSMPGAYLGKVQHPDLGEVEFIASDTDSMVVIASFDQVFVLSPENPDKFIDSFSRALEMGSLSPIEAFSAKPAEFVRSVFADRVARISFIASLLLTVLLIVITSLLIPLQSSVSMGINASGVPLEPIASNRLLILPLLGSFAVVMDWGVGSFFYRKPEQRVVSYAIWVTAVVTPVLLIAGLLTIVF